MRSISFSKQKSFRSFKTKGVSNFKTAFDLASYIVYRMSCQDNATFVEQSLSTVVSFAAVFNFFFFFFGGGGGERCVTSPNNGCEGEAYSGTLPRLKSP